MPKIKGIELKKDTVKERIKNYQTLTVVEHIGLRTLA